MTTPVSTRAAGGDVGLEPVCADCRAHDGLCASHHFESLPAHLRPLRTNWPVWLMGPNWYDQRREESPAARRIRERKARKAQRRHALRTDLPDAAAFPWPTLTEAA